MASVHHVDDPRLDRFAAAAWATGIAQVAAATGVDAVVAAGTPRGNEVLAHLAARLDVPMAAGAVPGLRFQSQEIGKKRNANPTAIE